MTLYLKYRPQTIEELDLTSVRESLKKVLSAKNVPHAFLFSGPRGAGKTSAARIVAKALNCTNLQNGEPCNKCDQCNAINSGNHVDIIELDAASNRGIDDIRALREAVGLSPQTATKKVYIIDEAHMLTTEAANAFLKTLEEPPSHVQFIFATTDPQKLPETVRSRLHTIHFTKATPEEISRQLERVIKGENIEVEDGVVPQIASTVDGSFRDAVKKLEGMLLGNEKITLEIANNYLYNNTDIDVNNLLEMLANKEAKPVLEKIQQYTNEGGDVKQLLERMTDLLRKKMLAIFGVGEESKLNISTNEIVELLGLLVEARGNISKAHISSLPLELAVAKWCAGKTPAVQEIKKELPAPVAKQEPKEDKVSQPATSQTVSVADLLDQKIEAMKPVTVQKSTSEASSNSEVWPQILAKAKQTNIAMEALLRAAEVLEYNGDTLKLGVYYQFHKESLESAKNRTVLDNIVQEVCGPVKLSFALTQPKSNGVVTDVLTEAQDTDIIDAAKEIFGE